MYIINEFNKLGLESYLARYSKDYVKSQIFYKHSDYSGEEEYRIAVLKENHESEYYEMNIFDILKGVVVGVNFPKIYYTILKEEFNELRIFSKKLCLVRSDYHVVDIV